MASPTESALARFTSEYLEFHQISRERRVDQLRVLRELASFAGKEILEVTSQDLKGFMNHLTEQGFVPGTVGKKLSMIRPFYNWAWENELIGADQYMRILKAPPPRGAGKRLLPRPYSRKQIQQFWAELDECWPKVDEKFWKRWRKGTSRFKKVKSHVMRIQMEAIVVLALHCGLRRQEIFDAKIDDIHHDNAYVVVPKGKGGKFREVPHTQTSRAAIRNWLELREELGPEHNRPWLSLYSEKVALNPMSWKRFRDLPRTIGRWEYHRLRHTCGTEWLRSIKRIEIVQRLLGHASIQQTLGYAALVNDDILQAVAKSERQFEEAVAA